MSKKVIDLDKSVYETCSEFPEVKEVMARLGFEAITQPGMLQSAGRIMTIRKGAGVRGVPVEDIVNAFQEAGFAVAGLQGAKGDIADPTEAESEPEPSPAKPAADDPAAARQRELEGMVRRLSDGESLESVREDFVRDFSSVSASEIAQAEQSLIQSGMPVREVQQLCDVHSALFHGKTTEEIEDEANCHVLTSTTEDGLPAGHPISALRLENRGLEAFLDQMEPQLVEGADTQTIRNLMIKLRELKQHYSRKEELLMPLLTEYGFPGPNDVMWGVDDEILDERSQLVKALYDPNHLSHISDTELARIKAMVTRIREMVYKEENILYPLALDHFSKEDWYVCYRDLNEFGWAFCDGAPKWLDGEVWVRMQPKPSNPGLNGLEELAEAAGDGKIHLPTGELSVSELSAILKVLPLDLTFIDATDHTRFFMNEGHVFNRPLSCLGREVYSCHPPRLKPMIKDMLQGFREHQMDHFERWIPNPQNPIRVLYQAIYDDEGAYLGTLEIVQEFGKYLDKLR